MRLQSAKAGPASAGGRPGAGQGFQAPKPEAALIPPETLKGPGRLWIGAETEGTQRRPHPKSRLGKNHECTPAKSPESPGPPIRRPQGKEHLRQRLRSSAPRCRCRYSAITIGFWPAANGAWRSSGTRCAQAVTCACPSRSSQPDARRGHPDLRQLRSLPAPCQRIREPIPRSFGKCEGPGERPRKRKVPAMPSENTPASPLCPLRISRAPSCSSRICARGTPRESRRMSQLLHRHELRSGRPALLSCRFQPCPALRRHHQHRHRISPCAQRRGSEAPICAGPDSETRRLGIQPVLPGVLDISDRGAGDRRGPLPQAALPPGGSREAAGVR